MNNKQRNDKIKIQRIMRRLSEEKETEKINNAWNLCKKMLAKIESEKD